MKLQPIHPFEPISAEVIPNGTDWVSQIKWDGVRVLTYYDGHETKLFNRKLNGRTAIFPELTKVKSYSSATSMILDGEVIAFDKAGKPSFHEVMRRDGIRRLDRVKEAMNNVPIYYMIFDIVFLNGDWVNTLPFMDRLELLTTNLNPTQQIQIVPTQNDGATLFEVTKEHNLEGIICKNLNSRYVIDGKNSDWRKIKNYKDIIAVVGGVTYRSGVVNSMLVGLFDNQDQFLYVGHVGTGKLTNVEWREFTSIIESIKINDKPFSNQPKRIKNVQWIKPVITVKLQYIDWPEGHSLRQPSIQAFVDLPPEKCILIQ